MWFVVGGSPVVSNLSSCSEVVVEAVGSGVGAEVVGDAVGSGIGAEVVGDSVGGSDVAVLAVVPPRSS